VAEVSLLSKTAFDITVDSHEPHKAVVLLEKYGLKPVVFPLPIGDYTTNELIIERKEVKDFHQSKQNSRLAHQLYEMSKDPRIGWLVIHGSPFEVGAVTREMLWGLTAACSARYGINVIWVETFDFALYVIAKLAKAAAESKIGIPYPKRIKVKHRDDRIRALQQAFSLPEKVAIALLKRYKTVSKICQLTKRQLLEVPGIGHVRADRIYNILYSAKEIELPPRRKPPEYRGFPL